MFLKQNGLSLDIDFPEYSFLMSEDDWEQSAEAEMERYISPLVRYLRKVRLYDISMT